jgi:hypothetical protein
MLQYGKRATIDKALSRLVKRGYIIRLTRGLFRREHYDIPLPALAEIAQYKATVFNKMIIAQDIHTANTQLSSTNEKVNDTDPIFATNGRSSSFRCGDTIIKLKGISPKKLEQLKP